MSDTPTPRVGEQIVYLLDDTMNEMEAVPAEFARQLERELAEWKDKFDGGQMAHAATLADLRDCKEQLAETSRDFRCLAELVDGHDATECRANLVKLQAELAAERALPANLLDVRVICDQRDKALEDLHRERALADRLAGELQWWGDYCGDNAPASIDLTLAAWKEARNPNGSTERPYNPIPSADEIDAHLDELAAKSERDWKPLEGDAE